MSSVCCSPLIWFLQRWASGRRAYVLLPIVAQPRSVFPASSAEMLTLHSLCMVPAEGFKEVGWLFVARCVAGARKASVAEQWGNVSGGLWRWLYILGWRVSANKSRRLELHPLWPGCWKIEGGHRRQTPPLCPKPILKTGQESFTGEFYIFFPCQGRGSINGEAGALSYTRTS